MPIERLWETGAPLRERLQRLQTKIGGEIIDASAYIGGGSAPDAHIPGPALALIGEDSLLDPLRHGDPPAPGASTPPSSPSDSPESFPGPISPVMAYAREGNLILDLRTVEPEDDEELARAVLRARLGHQDRTAP